MPKCRFIIVGGGLTATAMLTHFTEAVARRVSAGERIAGDVHLSILEKQDHFGPGFPHNPRVVMPFHITNMCAADMGIDRERKTDFQVWINDNLKLLRNRFPHYPPTYFEPAFPPTACRHYPRAFMGEYLKSRFQQACQAARQTGIEVHLYPHHEVINIEPAGGALALSARCRSAGNFLELPGHGLLLATGHWFARTRRENYFDSPWPAADLLASIPPGASVGVLGSSLSAIETVLTLTSDGKFAKDDRGQLHYRAPSNSRRIALFSRRGLLPRVRGPLSSYHNRWLTKNRFKRLMAAEDKGLTLGATFTLLELELASAYGRPLARKELDALRRNSSDLLSRDVAEACTAGSRGQGVIWQTVLSQTFEFIREWYLKLAPEERRRFDRSYSSLFFSHAATQPLDNARKVLALLECGVLKVVRLGPDYRLYRDHAGGYRFDYSDPQGRPQTESCPYIVNATGQQRSLKSDPSPLARNLVTSGIAAHRFDPTDDAESSSATSVGDLNIKIDPGTHRVKVSPEHWPRPPHIYAVGAMTRNQIIDASMARSICRSTGTVAEQWVSLLRMRSRKRAHSSASRRSR